MMGKLSSYMLKIKICLLGYSNKDADENIPQALGRFASVSLGNFADIHTVQHASLSLSLSSTEWVRKWYGKNNVISYSTVL